MATTDLQHLAALTLALLFLGVGPSCQEASKNGEATSSPADTTGVASVPGQPADTSRPASQLHGKWQLQTLALGDETTIEPWLKDRVQQHAEVMQRLHTLTLRPNGRYESVMPSPVEQDKLKTYNGTWEFLASDSLLILDEDSDPDQDTLQVLAAGANQLKLRFRQEHFTALRIYQPFKPPKS